MSFAEKGKYTWAVFAKPDGKSGYQIFADRMEATPNGHLVFYQRKGDADVVVHVQATGTFTTCEILSAWDGCPTHAIPLVTPE